MLNGDILTIVAISGTGGTGKTSVVKELRKVLNNYKLVELNKLARQIKAYKRYDAARKTNIVDMRKLKAGVKKIAKQYKNLIIEGLFAHEFDADIVIILRCRPDILKQRLEKKYSWPTKIKENVEAELLGAISEEAVAKHGREKVFEVDTTGRTAQQTAKIITKIIDKRPDKYSVGKINWMKKRRLLKRILQ